MPSIRRFLLISLLGAVSLITFSTAYWTYNNVISQVDELLDGQLVEAGHILRRLVTQDASRSCLARLQLRAHTAEQEITEEVPFSSVIDESFPYYHHHYEVQRAFQVWSDDGSLLIKSSTAPEFPLSSKLEGFTNTKIGDSNWRVFTLRVPRYGLRFQVAQLEDIRDKLIKTIAITEIYPLLFMYPILGFFIWYAVGHALNQIQRVAGGVKALHDPKKLSLVDIQRVPSELHPLVNDLNDLFERLQAAFARETRFAADAAHEMRTPLAVVKTYAQVAMRATDIAEQQRALSKVINGVDRCTHVVQQLSTLNKLKPDEPIHDPEFIQLKPLSSEVISELISDAILLNTEVELIAGEDAATIYGNLTCIRILLRNLIDNAIRYTGKNGHVKIIIEVAAVTVTFRVIDNGPGIPAALRKRVFDRFYRQLGTKVQGSGLGLSIVSQIAALHNADIALDDAPGKQGLAVSVTFARAKKIPRLLKQP